MNEKKPPGSRVGNKFIPFEAIEYSKGAIKILNVKVGKSTKETEYFVQFDCCGKTQWKSHRYVVQKLRQQRKHCNDCGRRLIEPKIRAAATLKKEMLSKKTYGTEQYGVIPPEWPVPKSVPKGYWLLGKRPSLLTDVKG